MAVTTQAAVAGTCPTCGQPLLTKQAVAQARKVEQQVREDERTKVLAAADTRLRKAAAEFNRRIDQLRADHMRATQEAVAKARAQVRTQAARGGERLAAENKKLKDQLRAARNTSAAEIEAAVAKAVESAKDTERAAAAKARAAENRRTDRVRQSLEGQVARLQRKVEAMQPQDRGDLGEEKIYHDLYQAFPHDEIRRVRRGQRGADIIHHVMTSSGSGERVCTIVYDSKNTGRWATKNLNQVVRAKERHKASIALLVTPTFPAGEEVLTARDGVIVAHPTVYLPYIREVRRVAVECHQTLRTAQLGDEAAGELWRYCTSEEFRRHFHGFWDIHTEMQSWQESEKARQERAWVYFQAHLDHFAHHYVSTQTRLAMITGAMAEA